MMLQIAKCNIDPWLVMQQCRPFARSRSHLVEGQSPGESQWYVDRDRDQPIESSSGQIRGLVTSLACMVEQAAVSEAHVS